MMLVTWAALIGAWQRPRMLATLVPALVAAAALLPVWRVVADVTSRDVQRAGERRFAGFYEVARAAAVEPDAVVYVSEQLYDGAIRGGVLPALTRMNFNLRLPPNQLLRGTPLGENADYAVLSFAEYQAWRAARGAEPPDVIVSADRQVALLCLRGACPRIRPAS
jgi:hypothetical protein